jgi:RNA polymerase sigma-70 factor (ECF subfamily)
MIATLEIPQTIPAFAPRATETTGATGLSNWPNSPHSTTPKEERIAIARTLQGDPNAFNELVNRYQRLAYSVAYRMLQNKEAASDAVQESFLKAYRALSTFKGDSFKSWLMRIVANTCYDMLRLDRRLATESIRDEPDYAEDSEQSHPLMDNNELPAAFVERMELHSQLELGLRILPAEQRLALMLYDIHGYSYDEITESTGLPMGTLKSRISRGRARLRGFLLQEPNLLPGGFRV